MTTYFFAAASPQEIRDVALYSSLTEALAEREKHKDMGVPCHCKLFIVTIQELSESFNAEMSVLSRAIAKAEGLV